ncbi:DEAD/DEAH box helicase family protein [Vibrio sp. SCSIO 43140]|uniref:DEAD/DEAH box helicase family protein n=1 Tax=Vibrio sp. SCSIO 43140 TaxID=2819100 RepID=UPI0020750B75|nr:DEAD/DEAH box helicase family protein [Vibrio sp. SCSIO 43140]USD59496.1 DEAD/DEAH box helicase family protein [Vibrio sp. SCSIO 43140]
MKLSDLQLKGKYDSDEDDILESFHNPLLSVAERYDRAVGYFSSEVLVSVCEGLDHFIRANGQMRLIIGDPLSDSEYEAVMEGKINPIASRSETLERILNDTYNRNLKILKYLIATKHLEIKFAFTHQGMFHKKIGVFYKGDEMVTFNGSANETIRGLTKYNAEEITAYFSWEKEHFDKYGKYEVTKFEELWSDSSKRTKVIELDSESYARIQTSVEPESLYRELFPEEINQVNEDKCERHSPFFAYSFPKSAQKVSAIDIKSMLPRTPLNIKGKPFQLFAHQREAINSWKSADHQGLFKLATGSGKTFTSICAMVELYEERRRNNESTFVMISVPYIELANQWVEELTAFNVSPIRCYDGFESWASLLDKKILRFLGGSLPFVCVVVVNRTLSDSPFQQRISKIPVSSLMVIGDECHNLGSQGYYEALPCAQYRIGLSATPFRSDEDEVEGTPFPDTAKQNLLSYFNGIVAEYSLSDAIRDEILAPYRYELVPVYLTDDEQEKYEDYSLKIQKLILKAKSSGLSGEERGALTKWCGFRARLLATCSGKLPSLLNYLQSKQKVTLSHSLIYVGEGKSDSDNYYISEVTDALHSIGCKVAKFTSVETSKERATIMNNFKDKSIDALVAMKVLDEGIDVPVCKSAYILASTRNPRQYVQRRGRVLRKSEGKEQASIVDFVVLPLPGSRSSFSDNLRKAELERVNDFKLTALNSREVEERAFELGII